MIEIIEQKNKIIDAYYKRQEAFYAIIESKQEEKFSGAELLELLNKISMENPIILGKTSGE
jgi:hypothetical protein